MSLAVGGNAVKVRVTAEDGETILAYTVAVSRAAPTSDAALSALALTHDDGGTETGIELDPAFASGIYNYTAQVAYPVDRNTVAATRNDDTATVALLDGDDEPIADQEGHQMSLEVGDNAIRGRVTAEDGETVLTYTVEVRRDGECQQDDDPDTCTGEFLERLGISMPSCQDNGVFFFWQTGNHGEAEAPEGWKIERRHQDSERWVVRTFSFTGSQADALQTYGEEYWDWVDASVEGNLRYTYRVRTINADGSDLDGRVWSRRASAEC